jgi:hypothetical protein
MFFQFASGLMEVEQVQCQKIGSVPSQQVVQTAVNGQILDFCEFRTRNSLPPLPEEES